MADYKIINGDCLGLLRNRYCIKQITNKNNRIVIFMDPPDNIGFKYEDSDNGDKMRADDYYNWLNLIILECLLIGKIIWISYNSVHDMELKYMLRNILKYKHPSFKLDTFIWRYTFSQYNDLDCAKGYRPIIRLKRIDTEMYPEQIKEVSGRQLLGDKRAKIGGRVPDNVWSIPRVVVNHHERRAWHPTQHPIALMERIIKFSMKSGCSKDGCSASMKDEDYIIDLFGGTGTTLRAAMKLEKNCILIEKSITYCKLLEAELGIKVDNDASHHY